MNVFIWIGILIVGTLLVGIASKWISYNVATGFYQGKKTFYTKLKEFKDEEKNKSS